MIEVVNFEVDATAVKADLYLPPDLKPGERRPAMVCSQDQAE